MIAATGFETPLLDLPELGLVTVNDGRIPALTPFWESVSLPGVYFAGNASQGAKGIGKRGAGASSTSVNGFRYNARVLAEHLAARLDGWERAARARSSDPVSFLLRELSGAPELWVQKGYLCRVLADEEGGFVDDGILPLAHFLDALDHDAVAASVEVDEAGRILPTLYLRRGGEITERQLEPHPLHELRERAVPPRGRRAPLLLAPPTCRRRVVQMFAILPPRPSSTSARTSFCRGNAVKTSTAKVSRMREYSCPWSAWTGRSGRSSKRTVTYTRGPRRVSGQIHGDGSRDDDLFPARVECVSGRDRQLPGSVCARTHLEAADDSPTVKETVVAARLLTMVELLLLEIVDTEDLADEVARTLAGAHVLIVTDAADTRQLVPGVTKPDAHELCGPQRREADLDHHDRRARCRLRRRVRAAADEERLGGVLRRRSRPRGTSRRGTPHELRIVLHVGSSLGSKATQPRPRSMLSSR